MKVKPMKHAGSGGPLMALPSMLKGLPDMERGITRIFHRTANPVEFVQVLQALANIAPQLGIQVSTSVTPQPEENVSAQSKAYRASI